MGGQEIIEVLERAKKPLTRTEIAKRINKRLDYTSGKLAKLLKSNEIKCLELPREEAKKIVPGINRRMRMYYV